MFLNDLYLNLIHGIFKPFFDIDSFWGTILIGDYGVLTMTPVFLIGVLLPLVAGFFLLQHILDESGIILRIAKLLNKPFHVLGLNGDAIIPLLLGFGCVTAALVSTNILGTKRERLISSVLLCITIPCSAQVAIIFALAFLLELKYMLLYLAIIFLLFILLGSFMNLLLPGSIRPIPLKMVPLTFPDLKGIIKKTAKESLKFLKESGFTFFVGSILISIIDYYGGFLKLREWFSPITAGFLNLPDTATNLFVLSIIKRDLGAAGLYSMVTKGSFTQPEILVTLLVLTLFVPCFASQVILFKEQRFFDAVLIWIGSFAMAFLSGGIVSWFLL